MINENWEFWNLENSNALAQTKTRVLHKNSSFHLFMKSQNWQFYLKLAVLPFVQIFSEMPKLEFWPKTRVLTQNSSFHLSAKSLSFSSEKFAIWLSWLYNCSNHHQNTLRTNILPLFDDDNTCKLSFVKNLREWFHLKISWVKWMMNQNEKDKIRVWQQQQPFKFITHS